MSIGERIKERMKDLGLRQVDVAKRSGLGKSNVSQYYHDKGHPDSDNIFKLAKGLQVSPHWLKTGRGKKEVSQKDGFDLRELLPSITKYPLIEWSELRSFYTMEQGSIVDFVASPYEGGSDSYVLRVAGESMLPEFDPGDVILLDPSLEIEDKDYIAVSLTPDSQPILRQLIIEGESKMLKALNSNYPNQYTEFNSSCESFGVVIGKWKKYKD